MAFQRHRELEERLVREPRPVGTGQRTGGQQARADRRRRRAEPPPVRYRVRAAQGDSWRLPADRAKRRAHGPDHQVPLARCRGATALAGHLDDQPAVRDPGLDLVVQRQRQAQRVKPGPQVGAGGGRAHAGGLL